MLPKNNQGLSTLTRIADIGMPGATVEVDNLGVMTTTVAPNGTWSVMVQYALPNGAHSVKVVYRAGNSVETGYISFRVINAPAIPAPTILAPAEGAAVPVPTLTIAGTALPGYFISLCLTDVACVFTTADGSGSFMASYPYPLPSGAYVRPRRRPTRHWGCQRRADPQLQRADNRLKHFAVISNGASIARTLRCFDYRIICAP